MIMMKDVLIFAAFMVSASGTELRAGRKHLTLQMESEPASVEGIEPKSTKLAENALVIRGDALATLAKETLMVITDLDDTFYPTNIVDEDEKSIFEEALAENKELWKKFRDKKIPFAVNTGNNLKLVEKKLGSEQAYSMGGIFCGGALVVKDGGTGNGDTPQKVVYKASLDQVDKALLEKKGELELEESFANKVIDTWKKDPAQPWKLSCVIFLGWRDSIFVIPEVDETFTQEDQNKHMDVLEQCKKEWNAKMGLAIDDIVVVCQGKGGDGFSSALPCQDFPSSDQLIVIVVLGVIGNTYEEDGTLLSTDWGTVRTVQNMFSNAEWVKTINGWEVAADKYISYEISQDESKKLGMGPEIDFKVKGVQKALGALKYWLHLCGFQGTIGLKHLTKEEQHKFTAWSKRIAVFGDAPNDAELFGFKTVDGGGWAKLTSPPFHPDLKVAMPWGKKELKDIASVTSDSQGNIMATVLEEILEQHQENMDASAFKLEFCPSSRDGLPETGISESEEPSLPL